MQKYPPVRRVVTGNDKDGHSVILEDRTPAPSTATELRTVYNVWRTLGPDSPPEAPDTIAEQVGIEPPRNGTVLRVVDFPPESKNPEERRQQNAAMFASVWPGSTHDTNSDRHPGMHITDSVDYGIVLQGEITAVMDTGETVLRAGDILIQRGTWHAWANRSDTIARVVFILIDAHR